MACRVCETEVPAAAFCGTCGANLTAGVGMDAGARGSARTRRLPGEHTLRLTVASSIFPHLPHRSLTPFRVGLAALFLL